jgi:hypothetical protein
MSLSYTSDLCSPLPAFQALPFRYLHSFPDLRGILDAPLPWCFQMKRAIRPPLMEYNQLVWVIHSPFIIFFIARAAVNHRVRILDFSIALHLRYHKIYSKCLLWILPWRKYSLAVWSQVKFQMVRVLMSNAKHRVATECKELFQVLNC